jgi:hypothetical protein
MDKPFHGYRTAFHGQYDGRAIGLSSKLSTSGLTSARPSIYRRLTMIFELRTYYCAPGRLPALNKRFETITLKFWDKYGIRQVGFWTTLIGPSNQTLSYMLQWESLAERETKWNAFASDPEWLAKRAESEAQAIIVERIENQILAPTPYSAMQ